MSPLDAPIPCGPFDLVARLGRGGMGTVYRAVHRRQQAEVAVKVVTSNAARQERFHTRFHAEIRAVATLDHQNVVWVYDSGLLDDAAQEASEGQLRAGSPWLAMQLADRGSAADGVQNWADLKRALRGVLRGLAHAHSRGILHLDIKPENVLWLGGRAVLTDFGLARRLDESGSARREGTVGYMSPEQLQGRASDYGPWTDLFAVGRMVMALVSGSVEGGRPWFPVPHDIDGWVDDLTAPDRRDRYAFAADALEGLEALADPAPGQDAAQRPELRTSTDTLAGFIIDDAAPSVEVWTNAVNPAPRTPSKDRSRARIPVDPAEWRPPRPARLVGVGLGLFGVRLLPFLGRTDERQRLWGHLRVAASEGTSALVLVRSPPGVGARRLAGWLGERAHETGAAWVVGPGDDQAERLAQALVARQSDPGDPRPLVVIVPATSSAVSYVEGVVGAHDAVLAVCSLADGDLSADEVVEATQNRGVAATDVITLGPLPLPVVHELVWAQLGVEPTLAWRVAQMSGGNLGYALAIAGRWASSGALGITPLGLGLDTADRFPAAPIVADLPDLDGPTGQALELAAVLGHQVSHTAWSAACRHASIDADISMAIEALDGAAVARDGDFAFVDPAVREALRQRASAAGRAELWHRVAAEVALEIDESVPAEIGRHFLLGGRPERALSLLLEATTHAARYDSFGGGMAIVGDALQAAQEAGRPLDDPDRITIELSRCRMLADLRADLARHDLATLYQQLPAAAELQARVARELSYLHARNGSHHDALTWARRSADDADRGQDDALRGRCRRSLGLAYEKVRDFEAADKAYREAWPLCEPRDQPYVRRSLARILRLRGDLDGAREQHQSIRAELSRSAGRNRAVLAECLNEEGEVARLQGRFDEARDLYTQSLSTYREAGSVDVYAPMLNLSILELQARHDAAARDAVQSQLPALERFDSPGLLVVALGILCVVAARSGDTAAFDQLRERIEALRLRYSLALDDDDLAFEAWAREAWLAHDDATRAAKLRAGREDGPHP